MPVQLIWCAVWLLFLSALALPLMKRRPAVVPLWQPLAFLACETVLLSWLWQSGWTLSGRVTALLAFTFVGCLLAVQSLGRRRWFVFRGGGFRRDQATYEALAMAIRQALQEQRLAPAAVICRYDGWLGLAPMAPEAEAALIAHIDDALADTRWQRWGAWQLFFGVQWAVFALMLVHQSVHLSGGF